MINYLKNLKLNSRFIKWLFLAIMLWYLYKTLNEKEQGLYDIWQNIEKSLGQGQLGKLSILIFLTPINWAFEALKWQNLAQKIERISFFDALKGVLVGLSVSFVLPATIGDAAGRVSLLGSKNRLLGIGAALLANGLQFYVSLFFGTIGLSFFILKQNFLQTWYCYLLVVLCFFCLIFGLAMVIERHRLEHYLERFKWFRYVEKYVHVITQYSPSELWQAISWAVSRYCVFSLQFILLMNIFGIKLDIFESLMCVFLVFFAKTILPALNFLGDLGIRESASLFVFGFYDIVPATIVAATLTLWFVNIFLPVIIGSFWFVIAKIRD